MFIRKKLFSLFFILVIINCSQKVYDLDAEIKIKNDYVAENDCILMDIVFKLGYKEIINFNGFVFLKFYNESGDVEFIDVHRPVYRMDDWLPGSKIVYSRCIEVPENIQPGRYKIILGIFDPTRGEKRIKIKNKKYRIGEYYVGEINIIKAIYYFGAYGLEKEQNNCGDNSFVWLAKSAKIYLTNPAKDIILSLDLKAPVAYFKDKPQKVKIYVNKRFLKEIIFNSNDIINKKIKLSSGVLGERKFIELAFRSEQEFSPYLLGLGKDKRLLAVCLYKVDFKDIGSDS